MVFEIYTNRIMFVHTLMHTHAVCMHMHTSVPVLSSKPKIANHMHFGFSVNMRIRIQLPIENSRKGCIHYVTGRHHNTFADAQS